MPCHAMLAARNLKDVVKMHQTCLQDGDATISPHQESWDPPEAIWADLWPPPGPETGGECSAHHGMGRAVHSFFACM